MDASDSGANRPVEQDVAGSGVSPAARPTVQPATWPRYVLLPLLSASLALGLAHLPILSGLELLTFDLRMRLRPQPPRSEAIVYFDIDDAALLEHGMWPWPRDTIGAMLRLLTRAGARSILLDIEYSEPSRATVDLGATGADPVADLGRLEARLAAVRSAIESARTTTGTPVDAAGALEELELEARALGHALERGRQQHDLLLAAALGSAGIVHGVLHIDTDGPPGRSDLETRILGLLGQRPGATAGEAAGALGVALSVVEPQLERLRSEALCDAAARSVDAYPGKPVEWHMSRLLSGLSPQRMRPLRMALDALLERELSIAALMKRSGRHARLEDQLRLRDAHGVTPPLGALVRGFRALSFSNVTMDQDGVVRSVPLLWRARHGTLRQPGLMLALDWAGALDSELEVVEGPAIAFADRDGRRWEIPVDEQGDLLINWTRSVGGFPHYSAGGLRDALALESAHVENLRRLDSTGSGDRLSRLSSENPWWTSVAGRAPSSAADSAVVVELETIERVILSNAEEQLRMLARSAGRSLASTSGSGGDPRTVRRRERMTHIGQRLEFARRARRQLATAHDQVAALARDRVVLIGASATGLGDLAQTPYEKDHPGIGVHANVLNTILTQRHLRRAAPWVELALVLVLVTVSSVAILGTRLRVAASVSAGVFGAQLLVAQSALVRHGLWIPVVSPCLALALNSVVMLAYRYFSEYMERQQIERMFGYYLSREVIDQLKADPSRLRRGGQEVEITALFTDLAGFSTVSEQLTPQQVVEFINDYLGDCTEVLMEYQGTLERYEGDAIRAMFGAPVPQGDHAVRACHTSLAIQEVVRKLRERYRSTGGPELGMRIGLNTGRAVVGNIGARNRFNFTMMGDSVNLAARLEGANKFFGTAILIGETTFEAARHAIEAREVDRIRVAGRARALGIYELLARKGEATPQQLDRAAAYAEALALYRSRRFSDAARRFDEIDRQLGPDPTSKAMAVRSAEYVAMPPPEDWDGVYVLKGK
ncbi:MAG: CHASE2 domain-containing protein [Candidatus Wallbacteria bacterium]|nr:CHASE2 domain-containing protein [Candidatus Wallbacteria bacterium]